MSNFEKQYYEDDRFWSGEMLQDEANRKRIELTYASIPKDAKSLLDVGCGNGVFVNYIRTQNSEIKILAIDRSEAALKYVQSEKLVGEINDLPVSNKSFDCVTCLEVIEHLPVTIYDKSLEELARSSSKYIIVSVPYNECLEESYNQCPSCKSIFNFELHLRKFTKEDIDHLFDKHGFKCIKVETFGGGIVYKWHYEFRKFFYKEQFKKWNSPICPICGFSTAIERNIPATHTEDVSGKRKLISYLTSLPKLIWPKEYKPYWIMGIYERNKQ